MQRLLRLFLPHFIGLVLLGCGFAWAQQNAPNAQPTKPDLPVHKEEVVVTGTYEPVAVMDADRDVTLLEVHDTRALYPSLVDILRLDPAVDLEERAPNGVQLDLSIRGASFGQTLVLVDGLRMNDAQTGHHNLDSPMPYQSIDRIEVLHGSGSTMYGSDAIGGVVNFITAPPVATEVRAGSAFGNFGTNQQFGSAAVATKRWTEQASFGRDFSTGFTTDRDYRALTGSSETHAGTSLGATTVLLAGGDKPFGANQFYGPYPSWERTKSWFAGASQELGANTQVQFGYRRHTDLFELFRDNPALYTNDHVTDSWQAAIRRHNDLGRKLNVFYGMEAYRDTIDSNNFSPLGEAPALGHHERNRGGIYANLDWKPVERLSLSVGAREEYYSNGHGVFTPTIAGGYRLSERLKLRGSVGRAFRLPTYTDLYYNDPATVGNAGLQPETAWSYDGGLEWTIARRLAGSVTVFRRDEKNDIDYVLVPNDPTDLAAPLNLVPRTCTTPTSPGCIYQARNLQALSFTGVEAAVRWQVNGANQVSFSYAALTGAQQALNGLLSRYLFNYPVNNASMQWQSRLPGKIQLRTRVGVVERYNNDAYALWDVAVTRQFRRVRPFLQLSNLANTSYQEIAGVAMPGRSILGGVEVVLSRQAQAVPH
ncbi:MAG: TonB-dependent receptor [Candidatus Korobacteraceae bacterium]